ncbi:MAG: HNH endonuclease, partial [Candidatus Competibacteraceae bacterium]|nr:HNH endonuclease [Candidatus Competibacteraceae bacterium]
YLMTTLSRKDWYQYHQERHQAEERQKVDAQYGEELRDAKQALEEAEAAYTQAQKREAFSSRALAAIGIDSDYRKQILAPLEHDHILARRALSDAWERHRKRLNEADKRGVQKYQQLHQERKLELEARAERVAERKYESRLKYLERSPAIRSASRPLKQHLINEQSPDGENVVCYYCEQIIPIGESHLEHKRPVARGGTNSRGNLVLACATCNLRKGKKTHDEYLKYLESEKP